MIVKNVRIQDCADVRPGYSSKGAIINDPNGSLNVVIAQHITKGEPYYHNKEHSLFITPPKFYEKYLISPGDILFMSRGANNYSVLIMDVPQPSIAPQTFFIISAKRDILPEYLLWCLNHEMVKSQLNEIRSGAGTPMIPSSEFRNITIPLPELQTQQLIANINALQIKEKVLLQQLLDHTEKLHLATNKRILTSFSNN